MKLNMKLNYSIIIIYYK